MEIKIAEKVEKIQQQIDELIVEVNKLKGFEFICWSTLRDEALAYLKGYRDGKN